MQLRFASSLLLIAFAVQFLSVLPPAARAADPLAETWQTGYQGEDARRSHVLGYWQFKPEKPTADSSSRGHDLTLAGAKAVGEGKFDGALESFAGWPVIDKRHAAFVASSPALSPRGAFTVEMWIKPKPELTPNLSPVLMDKKYVAHTDYQFRLTTADKSGARRMQVFLGFGDGSETYFSEPFTAGDAWQHVAFAYDAAGEVRFYRNGAPLGGQTKSGRAAVAPGKHVLSIGDRVGSNYAGFPGLIDEVRICEGALEFRPVAVEFAAQRKAWLRMEQAQPIGVVVRNLSKSAADKLTLVLSLEGLGEKTIDVPPLAAGKTHRIDYPLDTSLRPDTYRLKARLEMPGEPPLVSEESTELAIVPRPLVRMPVMMWGLGSPEAVNKELPRLKDLGFTHCLGGRADYGNIWQAKEPVPPENPERIAATREMLDHCLANDFSIAFALSPGHWLKDRKDLQRVDRNGKPNAARPDVNAALPGLEEFCYNVGASIAQTYDAYPAWQAVLVNTETRDSSQVSFSDFDRQRYRKHSGRDIPEEVVVKNGVEWGKLKNFPVDRVIADDHPILEFYRWFWTVGDGWNGLNTAVHRGIHSTGRDDVWTWFDPSIRAASIGGSGGEVDVLSQWTYTNPDPLRIGYFCDEVFAMAANSPQRPGVMKMTQLFWYRTQSAPQKQGTATIANPFDDHDPDAAYITISPMHLRESFWTKIARPVRGIMYHGWQALVPTNSPSGYRYTNPDTKEEFRRLHRDVLAPLGPTLLQLADHPSDVAYLDSFTSQMFARRGSYGYSGDEAYLTLLHAQLQPRVIYEEQLLRDGLDQFKLLILCNCDVLTKGIVEKIHAFQQRGGLVIGDEHLAPAVKPDIRIDRVIRTKKGDVDNAAILAAAKRLRSQLDAKYRRPADSSNPQIVTRLRQSGDSDYLFVVNDHREFGTYVGQHGLVMENGLPSAGDVSMARSAGHVYDLLTNREVNASAKQGGLQWPVKLGPCEGGVFLVTPKAIDAVQIQAAESVAAGNRLPITIAVVDSSGSPVPAAIPLDVEISDPAGRRAEFSGFHCAADGKLDLELNLAANDLPGVWQIRTRELASGSTAAAYFRLQATAPDAGEQQ
jgi:hypothetical protein